MTQDEEIASSLVEAGIGSRYHRRTLGEFGAPGEMLRAWVAEGHHKADIHQGIGYHIVGQAKAHDLLVCLARACHLSGSGVRVLTLNKLVEAILDGTIVEKTTGIRALFLSAYFLRDYPANPLTPVQRMKVEDFLMTWIDDERALFVQSTDPIATTVTWWSALSVQRVAAASRELHAS